MPEPRIEVNVKNVKQTMARLGSFAPEQAKLINKKIRLEGNKIRDRARDYMPNVALSNWNNWPEHATEGYVGSIVKKNVKVTKANSRARGARYSNYIGVLSGDAAGAIFQIAGRGPSSDMFVDNLLAKNGNARGLWKAYDELKDEVAPAIMEAVREAEALVNQQNAELDVMVKKMEAEAKGF